MKYLLDTNVISEVVRPRPDARVEQWFLQAGDENLFLSAVTVAEIRRGIALLPSGARKRALHDWLFDTLLVQFSSRILVVDVAVSLTWGELVTQPAGARANAHALDAFIAATALVHECTLVTRNVKDFSAWNIDTLNPWLFNPA